MPSHQADSSLSGGPVSRGEVLRRAGFWVAQQVHYLSHDGHWPDEAPDPDGRPYRTDCSGFVSMAWRARSQPDTADFDVLGAEIDRENLLPGDALLWKGEGGYGTDGGHVLIFAGWADADRVDYLAYELSGGKSAQSLTMPYPYWDCDPRYVPWRYRHIVD